MNGNLLPYQKQAKNFIISHSHCGLFLDMGLGKTLTTLSALEDLMQTRDIKGHILVIAPKNIARTTWVDEIQKWGFNFRCQSLIINEKGKQLTANKRKALLFDALTAPQGIYFINRELIPSLIDFYVDRSVKPNGQYRFPQGWIFKTVVIDELQSFKSYNSERFKALKFVRPDIDRFIGLTGTPTPNGLEDLWSEIFLMDGGQRLGKNITTYRNTFFKPGRYMNGYPIEYLPKPGAEDEIYKRIKDLVISMKNTMLKLPPVTYNDVYVHMTDDEYKIYKEFMRTQVLTIDEDTEVTAANSAVLQAKLSQMASGAIYLPNEDNSDILVYQEIHKHKLEQLEYIVNNTDSPVLVAYHFRSDREMIEKYFMNLKDSPNATVFDGSPQMLKLWNSGAIPLMLIQPASAGHGLNFQQGGHTLVWYTITWSLEEYLQTNARLYRQGQKHPVVIHHLLTDKTVDPRILKGVLQKDENEQNLLEAVRLTIRNTLDNI